MRKMRWILNSKSMSLGSKGCLFTFLILLMTSFSIIFYNREGVFSSAFQKTFQTFVQSYKPSMIALFETKIRGKKIDDFIFKSGFDRSHHIEAVGFSGAI